MAMTRKPVTNITIATKTLAEIFALIGITYETDLLFSELIIIPFDSIPFHNEGE